MLRRSPRAVLLWAAAIVVAVVTAVSVGSTLASLRRQDRSYGRVRSVVVARHDLVLGTVVDRHDLTVARLRGVGVPAGALRDPGAAAGHVVAVPVLAGSFVTRRHLASRTRDGRDGVVPPGLRAMRIVVADGLRPRPGDVVDVYVTFPANSVPADIDPTLTVAERVGVIAVDDPHGGDDAAHAEQVGVTLLVPAEDAKRLAYAAATGTVALAGTPPEDAAAAPAG